MNRPIPVITASDLDGDLTLLALPVAQNPELWVVTIVHCDGTREIRQGDRGPGGCYPRFGSEQPDFKYSWYVDGFDDCHAEIQIPSEPGVHVPLRPTGGRCPHCRSVDGGGPDGGVH